MVCQSIGPETGSAAQDYIQLYEGDAPLLSESLGHIQQTATRIPQPSPQTIRSKRKGSSFQRRLLAFISGLYYSYVALDVTL